VSDDNFFPARRSICSAVVYAVRSKLYHGLSGSVYIRGTRIPKAAVVTSCA
jgi:hypothetical protein